MNTTEAERYRNEQKGKLMNEFATITDNNIKYEKNKKDEMFGKLQSKFGKTKEEMLKIIEALHSSSF